MKFHILTLFPEMVRQGLESSVTGRAMDRGLIELNTVNIRDFAGNKHGKVDDYPYGGGAGMLMQAQPVFDAWRSVCGAEADGLAESTILPEEQVSSSSGAALSRPGRRKHTIYVTPQGQPFTQRKARELAEEGELIILCGHYEGIDERVLEEVVTDCISIGDYVLTGGELAAMVIVDAVSRLVPGVLGNEESAEAESFHGDLLEYPQYSRPEIWRGRRVPEVLLSGNHRLVESWRLDRAKERTETARPDLYRRYEENQALIRQLSKDKRNHIHVIESLAGGRGEILYREGGSLLAADRDGAVCMALGAGAGHPEKLLEALPAKVKWIAADQEELAPGLLERGFRPVGKYSQYLYTSGQVLPVRHKDIRKLKAGDLPCVCAHYHNNAQKYARERIASGAVYGAFAEGRLTGFIGTHAWGGMGMLYVEEEYRGRGIGRSLLSCHINRMIERGRIPYCHVPQDGVAARCGMLDCHVPQDGASGHEAARHLVEQLGLYRASRPVRWWVQP